mmetsp:Transcript_35790/g.57023  ORF Transcript_35790/g.57023 Transcript_35790/m.57023 type:complete len:82 (-) Transcript_35790:68-313(-)
MRFLHLLLFVVSFVHTVTSYRRDMSSEKAGDLMKAIKSKSKVADVSKHGDSASQNPQNDRKESSAVPTTKGDATDPNEMSL